MRYNKRTGMFEDDEQPSQSSAQEQPSAATPDQPSEAPRSRTRSTTSSSSRSRTRSTASSGSRSRRASAAGAGSSRTTGSSGSTTTFSYAKSSRASGSAAVTQNNITINSSGETVEMTSRGMRITLGDREIIMDSTGIHIRRR